MDPNLPIDRQDVADIPLEDKGSCDFCQVEITDDEEERTVHDITLCESCASHYLD